MIRFVVWPTIFFFLGIALGSDFFDAAITVREFRQEMLKVQYRCEKEFAEYPRERGKKLIQGIEKCRKIAGLTMEGKK